MIYLIWGEAGERIRAARGLIEIEAKKHSNLAIFKFSVGDYSREKLEEVLVGQTLFRERLAVVLDELWTVEPELLIEKLSALAESPNLFLFLETMPESSVIEAIARVGGEVKKFPLANSRSGHPTFNPFILADALGQRDRKRTWVLFQEAFARGLAAEEIFWKLVWKIKTLLLVKTASDPSTLDLKPFVLSQAAKHSRNFTLAELKKISARFVVLWHDSRRGRTDFELGLERLILEL